MAAGPGLPWQEHDGARDPRLGLLARPTTVPELMATAATLLCLDPRKQFATPLGRPITITDNGAVIREILAWARPDRPPVRASGALS